MTKAFNRSQWSTDPRALAGTEKKCQGLRSTQAWDDSTVCDLDQLVNQSKALGQNARVAELLVLCGSMHPWWGTLERHATSTSDAVQAFLESCLPEDELAFVILCHSVFCHHKCG